MSEIVEKRGSEYEITPSTPAGPSEDAYLGSLAGSTSSSQNSTEYYYYEDNQYEQ